MALLAVGIAPGMAAPQFWGSAGTPRDGACFYKDANYHGEYFCVRNGEDMPSLPGDVSDSISSIRIFGRAEVTVFVDNRFRGRSQRFTNSVSNLKHDNLNDRVSSIRVRSGGGGWGGFSPGGGGS